MASSGNFATMNTLYIRQSRYNVRSIVMVNLTSRGPTSNWSTTDLLQDCTIVISTIEDLKTGIWYWEMRLDGYIDSDRICLYWCC